MQNGQHERKIRIFFFILYWCELYKATLAESKQEQNKWMEKKSQYTYT